MKNNDIITKDFIKFKSFVDIMEIYLEQLRKFYIGKEIEVLKNGYRINNMQLYITDIELLDAELKVKTSNLHWYPFNPKYIRLKEEE